MDVVDNVKRKECFEQVCVWHGIELGGSSPAKFEQDMADQLGVRVQYLETIKTRPDQKDGRAVAGTGGRSDIFFAVHQDDVSKFALARLAYGIRWIEDVLAQCNGNRSLYPSRVLEYRNWNTQDSEDSEEA